MVYVFSAGGKLLNSFKISSEAHCIAAGKNGEIFLGMKDHIEVYSRDGNRIGSWNSLGENAYITSVAVKKDRVVVADYGNKLLWLFYNVGNLIRFIKTITA